MKVKREPRTFLARYAGTCKDCEDHISVDDEIGYNDDGLIVCADCLLDTCKEPDLKACPECNLVHAGECL